MASFKLCLFLLVSVFAFYLHSAPVLCDDEEDNLLDGINKYRQNLSLPLLKESDKASCLADEIADELEDQPCENASDYIPEPGDGGADKIPKFEKHVKKCRINITTTTDGVVMPVCVPKLDPADLLSNYTQSDHYAKYVNDSKYTGAGIGSENQWMVLILTTNTSTGNFSSATSLLLNVCKAHHLLLPLLLSSFPFVDFSFPLFLG